MSTNRLVLIFALALSACGSKKQEPAPVVAKSENAQVSVHQQLVNAVHNYEGLALDKRLDLVSALVKKGANVNALNELREPVLGDAVHFGDGKSDDLRVVQLLVDSGADVNAVGETHRSPLTKAAEGGKTAVIELFLAHGLELNNENGTRALVKAAFLEHKEVVDLFLAHGFRASPEYAAALTADGMKSEETKAAAALFGAYVDGLRDELIPLLHSDGEGSRSATLATQLSHIEASCRAINSADAIDGNMKDWFNRPEECSSMGRLGALAYMQCYGLMRSNSANLERLTAQVNAAAGRARAPLKLEGMSFAAVSDSQELLRYDGEIRASMALYSDVLLPTVRAAGARLAHHTSRNQQLQAQARTCGNQTMLAGATSIGGAIGTMVNEQSGQLASFTKELGILEQMRAKIAYQLPALSGTEVLQQREEEARKKKQEGTQPKKG